MTRQGAAPYRQLRDGSVGLAFCRRYHGLGMATSCGWRLGYFGSDFVRLFIPAKSRVLAYFFYVHCGVGSDPSSAYQASNYSSVSSSILYSTLFIEMTTSFSSLPIIDLSSFSCSNPSEEQLSALSKELYHVFATTGFAYLINAPLSFSHEEVFSMAKDFFEISEGAKMELAKKTFRKENSNTYRG